MWSPLILLFLVGAVLTDQQHQNAWKIGKEYQYLVRSRTVTGLDRLANQYTGIVMKGVLLVQPETPEILRAKLMKPQYAQIHKELPDGWESEIQDENLELQDIPMSNKPFEIKIKHGVVRELIMDKNVPTWEVNMLKSIVSQLQVDTQGENAIRSRSTQVPEPDQPYAMFKAMEDSVGGKCEVLYDITPLTEYSLQENPELVPMPELRAEGEHIDIMKTKNYSRCDQRMGYHFGITGKTNWEPGSNNNGELLSKSSTSRVVITGNLEKFTIQSSVTTNKMFVSPRLHDNQAGMVVAKMNLTLVNIDQPKEPLDSLQNPESVGNLVYVYNNPFSATENRRTTKPHVSLSSKVASDENSSDKSNRKNSLEDERRYNSDKGEDYLQSKPTLNDPPQSPLLPFTIGYKGKSILMSNKIDAVKAGKSLTLEISDELENPSKIPEQQTLEKFNILSRLVRTMSTNQISELENAIESASNTVSSEEKTERQTTRHVLRDAVAQAGTGPALMTIKRWLESDKIKDKEAANVLSRIPKTARTPTEEYINAFFEMVKMPKVKEQNNVNSSAVLAFAELVRKALVDEKSAHNNYPVHSFGHFRSKHDSPVSREYIPYFAEELQKAIKDGDSPRIQTFIVALGNTGDPKIVGVFEPYLEGRKPVSNYQRLLMVLSFSGLAETHPRLARGILFKIYLNTHERNDIRSAAIFLIMETKPPLNMLQRMAEFTHRDGSETVNAVVRSSINAAASLKHPDMRHFARDARAASNLLAPSKKSSIDNSEDSSEDDSIPYFSNSFIHDAMNLDNNLAYTMKINKISSKDSALPKGLYFALATSYGGFKAPVVEMGSSISSFDDLKQIIFKIFQTFQDELEENGEPSPTEKIAKMLNIESDDPEQLEGNVFFNGKYSDRFFAFDNHTVNKIPELIEDVAQELINGIDLNSNKLESFDVTLSFPTETGLPFVYTLNVPSLTRISGRVELNLNESNSWKELLGDVRMNHAQKIAGRHGFITPFDHEHFVAGVDMTVAAYLPVRMNIQRQPNKSGRIELRVIQDSNKAKEIRPLHLSVIPYTSKHDILTLRPLQLDQNTHIVHTAESPKKVPIELPSNQDPILRAVIEADEFEMTKVTEDADWKSRDTLMRLIFPLGLQGNEYRKLDIFYKPSTQSDKYVALTAAFDMKNAKPENDKTEWDSEAQVKPPSDKQINSKNRRDEMLDEVAKGIKSAQAFIVDLGAELPTEPRTLLTATIAAAASDVDEKSRALLFFHADDSQKGHEIEVCVNTQLRLPETPRLDLDKAMKSNVEKEVDINIRLGQDCMKSPSINVKTIISKTEDQNEELENESIVKKCREQMKEGNKALPECQKAIALASIPNQGHIIMKTDNDLEAATINMFADGMIDVLKMITDVHPRMNYHSPENDDVNKVEAKIRLLDNAEKMNIAIYTAERDVVFPNIDIDALNQDDEEDVEESIIESNCVLDKNQALTFDGRVYPLKMGQCSHVAMTTFQKENPDNPVDLLRIPTDERLTILSRETNDGKKELKIHLGENIVEFSAKNDEPTVRVDGQQLELSPENPFKRADERNRPIFQILQLRDGSVKLVSDKYDVEVIYDGERALIEGTDKYRNDVRGLCGTNNEEPDDDFTTPKNCQLKKPEEFTASYALVDDKCEDTAVIENARKVEQSMASNSCVRKVNRFSNVISDKEAGRPDEEGKKWGYHESGQHSNQDCHKYRTMVMDVKDEWCFTVRPVPYCSSECKPIETKTKQYSLHCMPKWDPAAQELKRHVEKGATPDLSHKPPSRKHSIDVAVGCKSNV